MIDDPRYEAFLGILTKYDRQWVDSTQIISEMEILGHHIDLRTIGWFASQSNGRIIGTGNGYRLQDTASDEDILQSYGECIRRAIGTDLRARSIIRYARQHGRLSDDAFEQRKAQMQRKILEDTKSNPAEVYQAPKQQLALGI